MPIIIIVLPILIWILLLGLPENMFLKLMKITSMKCLKTKQVLYFSKTKVYQNRKDLQALDYQRKAASIGSKSCKIENLPTIAITGGYFAEMYLVYLTVTNAINVGVGVQYNFR